MATSWKQAFQSHLSLIKNEGRYRVFCEIARTNGTFPKAVARQADGTTKEVTIWSSNDYLGLSHHPFVTQSMKEAIDEFGAGSGGTRNISGNHPRIVELEKALAELHHKDAALMFTSGYVANEAALASLGSARPGTVIFSAYANHASMIEGIKHSGAKRVLFDHTDPATLESLLKELPTDTPKLIAIESLYSMEGDIPPLEAILEIAKRYDAFTYVDETHAVGVYGANGGGILEEKGLLEQVDVIQGGLGKGFGMVGGFVTGDAQSIDYIRSVGKGFIFTTSLPPVIAAGALASLAVRRVEHHRAKKLKNLVLYLRKRLDEAQIDYLPNESHITPVIIGDAAACNSAAKELFENHRLYVTPINYPTVPKGSERIRVTPTALLTEKMIDEFVEALSNVLGNKTMQYASLG